VLLLVQILFLWRQIIDYPNPDVNEDMKMFEMLGLNPQNHLLKFQPATVEAANSQFTTLRKAKMVETRSHY
jgi:biotin synthase